MSEIVFIMGAGASVTAGAPVMNKFMEKARDLMIDGKIEPSSIARFQRVFNAQSALQTVHSKAQLDLNNIESLLTTFEMAKTLNTFPFELMRNNDGSITIDNLIEDLKHLIRITIEQSMETGLTNDDGEIVPTSDYRGFSHLVANLKRNSNQLLSSIITFNYDLGLELGLNYFGLSIDYHLPNNISEKIQKISVIKPHGSLNWFKSGNHILHKDLQSMHVRRANENEPFIVPPTWNKSGYYETLSAVWQQAAKELKEARYIYVIGFSLPETDSFFRLLYALGTTGGDPLQEFIVYNPDPSVQSRFETLLGTGAISRFTFNKMYFNEAIQDIRKRKNIPVEEKDSQSFQETARVLSRF